MSIRLVDNSRLGGGLMRRIVGGWARRVHEQALANARSAATEASRRRVEAADVDAYLDARYAGRVITRHPSGIGALPPGAATTR
jgi:hypothetical protein